MAARATIDYKNAIIKTYFVKAGTASLEGRACKYTTLGTDTEVELAVAGDDGVCCGVWYQGENLTAPALPNPSVTRSQVVKPGAAVIAKMKVGTGGVTHGKKVKLTADGITNATDDSAASIGSCEQTGLVGDMVGISLSKS